MLCYCCASSPGLRRRRYDALLLSLFVALTPQLVPLWFNSLLAIELQLFLLCSKSVFAIEPQLFLLGPKLLLAILPQFFPLGPTCFSRSSRSSSRRCFSRSRVALTRDCHSSLVSLSSVAGSCAKPTLEKPAARQAIAIKNKLRFMISACPRTECKNCLVPTARFCGRPNSMTSLAQSFYTSDVMRNKPRARRNDPNFLA